jgi:hypothetical protein
MISSIVKLLRHRIFNKGLEVVRQSFWPGMLVGSEHFTLGS